jgi:ABC-2 type transport system ATP-binding protein
MFNILGVGGWFQLFKAGCIVITYNMETPLIIETKGLRKTYSYKSKEGKKVVAAVKGVDLAVREGEIFGFLGPNGAGKSTTQKMLSTLLCPTGGEAKIAGYDLSKEPEKIRKTIGYVSQAGGTDQQSTGLENLILQAQLYGLDYATANKNAKEFVERFQMGSYIERPAASYSGGQKRRLDVALGMVHHPKILLLDEPTTGLDPQSRAYLWEEIRKLKKDGVTIFLTTHYMDEADKLCDTIAIIDIGQIVAKGTPAELKNSIGADRVELGFSTQEAANDASTLLKEKIRPETINVLGNMIHLYVKNGERMLPEILRTLDAKNLIVENVTLSKPSLDDVFLKYTGRSLREDSEK